LGDYALSAAERRLLEELNRRGVRYLVVGVGAAALQGATTATEDVDLWFGSLDDPRIAEAVRAVGGVWIPGGVASRPPVIGGDALGDRFDVIVHMHGLEGFEVEYQTAKEMVLDGVAVRVLPLDRVIASKRALGRPRDIAQIPALEEALAALADDAEEA
jgi:hypothetical protein